MKSETWRTMQDRMKEHDWNIRLARTQTSAVWEHAYNTGDMQQPALERSNGWNHVNEKDDGQRLPSGHWMFLFLFYYQPLNRARKVISALFSHTKSAPAIFIYLFIYFFSYQFVYESEVLVTWFLVWDVTRLGSSILCRLCFVGGHFFFHLLLLYWFKIFSRCAFSSRGKWKSFSFLTFSLSIFKP